MTSTQIDEIIQNELNFNEFDYNKTGQKKFRGKHKTEYLESVLFYCPECSSLDSLRSDGNEFYCKDCGARVRINDTGFFEKINKAGKIPETILDWSIVQLDFIKKFDYSPFAEKPVFCDNDVIFSKVEKAVKEDFLGKGSIALFNDRIEVCENVFSFKEITIAIVGVRKMTIYNKEKVFAVFAPDRINLVKYMICAWHLRYKYLNIIENFYGY